MLTATEKQRVKNFSADMDPHTAGAMMNLFEYTKPGCTHSANALFIAAHTGGGLSPEVVATFRPLGLVSSDGTLSQPIKAAIQKAIDEGYLKMHAPFDPSLRPDDPNDLILH